MGPVLSLRLNSHVYSLHYGFFDSPRMRDDVKQNDKSLVRNETLVVEPKTFSSLDSY